MLRQASDERSRQDHALTFRRRETTAEGMKVRPLRDQLLVARQDAQTQTEGGLIIPETAKEKPARGVVISAGKGRLDEKGERVPLQLKSGDTVLFTQWAGTEVELGGESYLLMSETDVLAVLDQ